MFARRILILCSLVLGLALAGCGDDDGNDDPVKGGPETCLQVEPTCDPYATCVYDEATKNPRCECLPGFEGDGKSCADVDECAAGLDVCDALATCENLETGGYTCTCPDGWTGDGFSGSFDFDGDGTVDYEASGCIDPDECALELDDCDENATCKDEVPDGFTCECNVGWTGDGKTCVDADECAAGTDDCGENAVCTNVDYDAATEKGFTCACAEGFAGDGYECADVDECELGTAVCDPNATCENTTGAYGCVCNPGWAGDGQSCADVDECAPTYAGTAERPACAAPSGAGAVSVCLNAEGTYACACDDRFAGDGFTCDMIAPTGAGAAHGCYIRPGDESVWCWGTGGTAGVEIGAPERMGTQTGFVQLSEDGTCAMKRDGTLWCWWPGVSRQDGTLVVDWKRVGGADGWIATTGGWGVRKDGTLWNWNVDAAPIVPYQYGVGTSWVDVCPGTFATCGVKTDGTAYCWNPLVEEELAVEGVSDFVALDCDGTLTCGLRASGAVDCFWPTLIPPETEGGEFTLEAVPYAVRFRDGRTGEVVEVFSEAAVGHHLDSVTGAPEPFVCAIFEDGRLGCAGFQRDNGELVGDLAPYSEPWLVRIAVPGEAPTSGKWRALAAGARHACAVHDGIVRCWGDNDQGQLGHATGGTLAPIEVTFPR